MRAVIAVIVLGTTSLYLNCPSRVVSAQGPSGNYEVVYSWPSIDYTWPSDSVKEEYIQHGKFVVSNNVPSGVRVFKDEVYVTVPRWFSGVPATLNKIVPPTSGKSALLQPFPSWENHTIGDCEAFQFVQAIEIEPSRGMMFIVDTGRSAVFTPTPANSCPAKLVIIDIEKKTELARYTFPQGVVNQSANYLNDIVLDYVDGEPAYAYITDTGKPGIVVFNLRDKTSYRFEDARTMSIEPDKPIIVDTIRLPADVPINGIAMSADFRYVYFSAVTGTSLYQVPTSALRDPKTNISTVIRKVGDKPAQSDAMVYAQKNLYFGGLSDRSLYRWEVSKDVERAGSEGKVTLGTTAALLKNVPELTWVDTLAIDDKGYLWFTCSSAGHLFTGQLNFSSPDPKFWMIKIHIGELSYLSQESTDEEQTAPPAESGTTVNNTINGVAMAQLTVPAVFLIAITQIFI